MQCTAALLPIGGAPDSCLERTHTPLLIHITNRIISLETLFSLSHGLPQAGLLLEGDLHNNMNK